MSNQDLIIPGELTLAVNVAGTAMFASPFPSGDFDLVLSGPPGGPLSFLVWKPLPDERENGGIERSVRRTFRLPPQPLSMAADDRVVLAGAEREALCFVESNGFSNTGWCVALIEQDASAVLVAFGCSIGGGAVSCSRVLEHPSLRLLASSLRVTH